VTIVGSDDVVISSFGGDAIVFEGNNETANLAGDAVDFTGAGQTIDVTGSGNDVFSSYAGDDVAFSDGSNNGASLSSGQITLTGADSGLTLVGTDNGVSDMSSGDTLFDEGSGNTIAMSSGSLDPRWRPRTIPSPSLDRQTARPCRRAPSPGDTVSRVVPFSIRGLRRGSAAGRSREKLAMAA
jgi:hypothetical protein